MMTSSEAGCALMCLITKDCVAASVTSTDDVMFCSLATGSTDVVDDSGSEIYVPGETKEIHLHLGFISSVKIDNLRSEAG